MGRSNKGINIKKLLTDYSNINQTFNNYPQLKERIISSEYNSFNEQLNKYPHSKEFYSTVVTLTNSYENFFKLINLDKAHFETSDENKLHIIDDFTRLLVESGSIYSLLIMYSNDHIESKLKNMYESNPFEKFDYNKWLYDQIADNKNHAAFLGNDVIIMNFFPDILNSKMLAIIFTVIGNACLLGEYLLGTSYNLVDTYLDDEEKEQHQFYLRLLLGNLNGYKSTIQYLIEKGVITDSIFDWEGKVSYLSESDSNITIKHFCELYREFVPQPIKELFDIVLNAEKGIRLNCI